MRSINDNDRREFLGNIMDAIEDFLEEKGIDIPNSEKEESDNPAILYGSDYGILCYDIERVLMAWGVLEDDKWNQIPAVDVAPVIRCKDCEFFDIDYGSDSYWNVPTVYKVCRLRGGGNFGTDENDFCSWGEKREEE